MSIKLNIFDHRIIFLTLSIYFILIPLTLRLNNDSLDFVDFVIACLALISIIIYFLFSKTKVTVRSILKYQPRSKSILFITFIILVYDIYTIYHLQTFSNRNHNYTRSYLVEEHSALYSQLVYLIYLYTKMYVFAYFCHRNKLSFYLVFCVQLYLYSHSDVRLMSLMPIIIFGCYGYFVGYIKITYIRLLVISLLSPFFLVFALLARGEKSGNTLELIQSFIVNFEVERFMGILYVAMESGNSFYYLRNIIIDSFVRIESGVIRNIFLPISRDNWVDKPEAISRIIAKEYNVGQYDNGGGAVATILGDGFFNGHFLGVFLIIICYAIVMSLIYNPLKQARRLNEHLDPGHVMLYAISVHQSLFFFRGFFSESIWRTVLLLIVFYVVSRLKFVKKEMQMSNLA